MKDLVLGSAATVLGGIASLVALGVLAERAWFLSRAQPTTGTVVAVEKNRYSNSARAGTYPVVEFTTPDGQSHRFEGYTSFPTRYNLGNRIDIYYVDGAFEDALIDDFIDMWLTPAIAGGLGVVLLPIGVVVLVGVRRRRRRLALRSSGARTEGRVVEADTSSVQQWGKTIQYLTVEAIDPTSGNARRFRSHGVPGQGDEWLGRTVTIFVDAKAPGHFFVDVPDP